MFYYFAKEIITFFHFEFDNLIEKGIKWLNLHADLVICLSSLGWQIWPAV